MSETDLEELGKRIARLRGDSFCSPKVIRGVEERLALQKFVRILKERTPLSASGYDSIVEELKSL